MRWRVERITLKGEGSKVKGKRRKAVKRQRSEIRYQKSDVSAKGERSQGPKAEGLKLKGEERI